MSERKTRIGWIRHGVTEWNYLGKIQGTTDIPLSLDGIRQAELLARRLVRDGGSWNGIVSSDLSRASHTARIVAEHLGIPLRTDARLRERAFGSAEGTTLEERLSRWGDDWRSLVPDQETDEAVLRRGTDFLSDFAARHSGEAWLVVTHGSFLARMLHLMCPGLHDDHLQNASLTVLERSGEGGWIPLLHNCTSHLAEGAAG
ncbi:histidine phosphatase family protein [Cohnella caldifontis]|uniref:histidine phosphatase family protein n=1 Tax=Cohnella caldifontis TaxID=3027471 RepID=UPI0023ECCB37|nr:histidine phosphatase family protein [Cohnella sp. YIM B05605]